MQQHEPPVLVPVLLALAAIVSCLAFATGSVSVTRSEFTWAADRIGDPAPLVLAAQSPQSLTATGPCSAVEGDSVVDLLTTGDPAQNTLALRGQDGRVWMTYAGLQAGPVLAADGACSVSLTYQRSDNTAVLAVGEQRATAELVPPRLGADAPDYRQFAVTRLGAAPGFSATLVTQPTTYSSSGWRLVWLLACLGSLAGLAVLLRRHYPGAAALTDAPKWASQDNVVAAIATVALVVVPPRFDDGWVLTTVRHYRELGFFSNYYSVDAAAQPQGFWWTWIEQLWLTAQWAPGFLLRLPTALLLLGTWWLLRRWVLSPAGVRGLAMWGAAMVAVTGLVGLQITIRPEPMIALLLAATVATVVRYARSREPYLLVLLGALSAFAIAAHQTGWCVIAASASTLPWARDWLRRPRNVVLATAAVVGSVCLALILAMLGSNAPLWWRSVRMFGRDTTTYQSFLDEGARIAALARFDNPPVTIAAVGLLMLAALGFMLRVERTGEVARAAGWASMAALGGLFLTSSKLVDHYAAVIPAAVVLAGIALQGLRPAVAVGTVPVLGVLGIMAFSRNGVWALGLDRVTSSVPETWSITGIAVVGATVAVVGVAWRGGWLRPEHATNVALVALTAAVTSLSLLPVVDEGLRHPASWFGQQAAALTGRTCGLLEAVEVRIPSPSVFDLPVVSEGAGSLPVGPQSAVWAKGPLFVPVQVEVGSAGGDTKSQVLPPSTDVWAEVPLPADATVVNWTQPGIAVVAAANVSAEPVLAVQPAQSPRWWVEPGLALQAPCVTSLPISSGVLSDARLSVGRPGWVGAGLLANTAQAAEASCAGSRSGLRGQCLVSLPPGETPLPGRQVRESVL